MSAGAAVRRFEGDATVRSVMTAAGVPLTFGIAPAGARAAAFMLDALLFGVLVILLVVVGTATTLIAGELGAAMSFVGFFLLANFWFAGIEILGRGRSIGKGAIGARVIDRHGGEATPGAILARNFMREIELWQPLKVAVAGPELFVDLPGWAVPISMIWILVLAMVPLFNRDRLRLGDMIAGTIVVSEPKRLLMPDLARDEVETPSAIRFTREQLDVYGIFELHVLEDVLRRGDRDAARRVAKTIAGKIGWQRAGGSGPIDPRAFLDAFYRAQRARLEQEALFGRRRERKRG